MKRRQASSRSSREIESDLSAFRREIRFEEKFCSRGILVRYNRYLLLRRVFVYVIAIKSIIGTHMPVCTRGALAGRRLKPTR